MAQKTKIRWAGVSLLLLISFPIFGCARKAPLQKETAPSSEEAAADAELGALSEAEAAKELRRLEEEEARDKAFSDLERREREEEERRVHRRLTEDQILAGQT
jgi:hypothetical protein